MDNLIFLDLDEAIRADVAQFAGTRDELSRRVCGSAQALRHKLAGFKGQFLRPDELIDLMLHSGGRHTVARNEARRQAAAKRRASPHLRWIKRKKIMRIMRRLKNRR